MDSQKPKIAMYVQRSFGDKLTAAFNFFNENWKILLKYSIYFILPICIVQALCMNTFMGGYTNLITSASRGQGDVLDYLGVSFWLSYGFLILFSAIGGLVMFSLVYALVKIYNAREERLVGLTFADLKPVLMRCMGRLFLMGLFLTGVFILFFTIMGVLIALTPFTLLLTIPLLIAVMIPLCLFPPIYLFEEIDLWGAFTKSLRVGFATWGGIFGISFVMSFISNVLYGVAAIPWYVVFMIGMVFSVSDAQSTMTSSMGYSVMMYLFGIIMLFGIYVSSIFPILGMAYQYGHSSEKMEHISIVDDIDKFEQL